MVSDEELLEMLSAVEYAGKISRQFSENSLKMASLSARPRGNLDPSFPSRLLRNTKCSQLWISGSSSLKASCTTRRFPLACLPSSFTKTIKSRRRVRTLFAARRWRKASVPEPRERRSAKPGSKSAPPRLFNSIASSMARARWRGPSSPR